MNQSQNKSSLMNTVSLTINIYCNKPDGYSLKYRLLKKCLREQEVNDLNVLAKKLRVRVSILKHKLKHNELFNKEQISRLVYFLGAENAFEIIYFPTIYIKRRVYWEVFGKYKHKEGSYERFKETRKP